MTLTNNSWIFSLSSARALCGEQPESAAVGEIAMGRESTRSRRDVLTASVATGIGGWLAAARSEAAQPPRRGKVKPAEVNATEDLMREHGVLRRVLLVYGEGIRRITAGTPPSADIFGSAANIVRRFIEGYHEKLEEEHVFPRMTKAGKQTELVKVLLAQHEAGRKLTSQILQQATPGALKDKTQSQQLIQSLGQFIRMYEPHAAREDTILFPAFHDMFTETEFDHLGEQFEAQEHRALGSAGFEGMVEQVAQLEKALQIYDLSEFTPRN